MPIGLSADAGQSPNGIGTSGPVPRIGNSGRGIPRTGDITHIGDIGNLGLHAQPGSIAQDVLRGPFEGPTNPPGAPFNRNFDVQQEQDNNYAGGALLFCGRDGSGEGFDSFSSKAGSRTG